MSELKDLIQQKKESKDYYTIQHNLITERDCFEAIEALGSRKTLLKQEIQKRLSENADPKTDTELQAIVLVANQIHHMQLQVVNDVCERFEVIHPLIDNPSEELLQVKQLYWNWYRDQYFKYYGKPAPEIVPG